MSENGYVHLKLNGAEIDGDSTQTEKAGVDLTKAIECEAMNIGLSIASTGEAGDARSGGRQIDFQPVSFTKRFDQTSPYLMESLLKEHDVQGVFRYFKTEGSSGAEVVDKEHTIAKGKITNISLSYDAVHGDASITETVLIDFDHIKLGFPRTGKFIDVDWSGDVS